MKLRNKKTGEIIDFDSITDLCFGKKIQLQSTNRYNKPIYIYNSLAELNAEWEDYELSILNQTMERIADSLEEISSSLSSIDDGIATISDSLENITERLDQDD